MTIPNLIHPVPIKIQRISTSSTMYDEDMREPIQQAKRAATATIQGQVKWTRQYALDYRKGGASEEAAGYILFRKLDMDAAGFTVQPNDRIVQMGTVETDVYVERLEWIGHYSDQGGPTMMKAYFGDRRPSKVTRGE